MARGRIELLNPCSSDMVKRLTDYLESVSGLIIMLIKHPMSKFLLETTKYLSLIFSKAHILVLGLYLFLVQKIAFPLNFQQDDVSELYIINFTEFACVVNAGDNHPLFTNLIWALSKIFEENIGYLMSSLNIIFTLISLMFFYKLIKRHTNHNIAILTTLIFLSSSNFIVYSMSIKQYPIEVFGCIFYLSILYEETSKESKNLDNCKKLFFVLLISFFSLTLISFFIVTIFLIFLNKKFNIKKIIKILLISSPSVYFVPYILRKLNRPSYREYWDNFFIDTSSLSELIESSSFIFNLVMKGYFGLFFYEKFALLYFIFLLIPIFFKDKVSFPSYFILLVFICFNFLKLYPLGGGRTDLILFPVLLFIISRSIYLLNLKKQFLNTLFVILLLLIPSLNEPYYKVENITPILNEISDSINNEESYILVMNEQRYSFEYYSSQLYGKVPISTIDGCNYLVPDISNYSIFSPISQKNWEVVFEDLKVKNPSEIILIGIELEGTVGLVRNAEKYLLQSGFTKVEEKEYDIGMLFIKYSN